MSQRKRVCSDNTRHALCPMELVPLSEIETEEFLL